MICVSFAPFKNLSCCKNLAVFMVTRVNGVYSIYILLYYFLLEGYKWPSLSDFLHSYFCLKWYPGIINNCTYSSVKISTYLKVESILILYTKSSQKFVLKWIWVEGITISATRILHILSFRFFFFSIQQ